MLGHYVTYKGAVWLVVRTFGNVQIDLNDPIANQRRRVSATSVAKTNLRPAAVVESFPEKFIVTAKKAIFSCKTGKLMHWSPTDGKRLAIYALLEASV